jgi:ethanolamine utilization protein EutQ
MTKVRHIRSGEMRFEPYGSPASGEASIARLVGKDMSASMGAGIATFDRCAIRWRVHYDELIVVLEGTFRLRFGEKDEGLIEARPFDVIWIPKDTPLVYEGDRARVFYALYPVDWK